MLATRPHLARIGCACPPTTVLIEAGVEAGPELPALRDRVLELFKVVSCNGRPEVWLLGQPLMVPGR